MRKLLLQLDSSRHASVFDQVVAYDAGADEVMSTAGVTAPEVRDLVHGCMFTRGPKDLKNTAIFIGGADIALGEAMLDAARKTFFGPMRVSVMLDSNGSNTTAVAAVSKIVAALGGSIRGQRVVVTAGTGPVGMRAAGLLAKVGADVHITSRRQADADRARDNIAKRFGGRVHAQCVADPRAVATSLEGARVLLNCGPVGVQVVPRDAWANRAGLALAVDLNAAPPLGIEGIEPTDDGVTRDGVRCIGALGVGNLKMKIHKACITRLFESNDAVLDAESIYELGTALASSARGTWLREPLRALGIDPGTVSIDLCGVDDGRLSVDETLPTRDALADPQGFVDRIIDLGPFACIGGPSGYGLPLTRAEDLGEDEVRLALLSATGESGGIGGLGALLRALKGSSLPVIFTPGVVHLPTVPAHRKVNRVDLGTADKVCAAALAIDAQATRRQCALAETSLILLELGGAFTAALAVAGGCIVDGIGGSAGPIGARAAGALDSEVAALAGHITKSTVFGGGAADIRGDGLPDLDALPQPATPRASMAWDAYVEGACKAVASLLISVPRPAEIVLSGRLARVRKVQEVFGDRLRDLAPVHYLVGFARVAKQAAQGAALIADGLAGGAHAPLVEQMAIRHASGSVLDWLYVIPPERARTDLGIGSSTPSHRE